MARRLLCKRVDVGGDVLRLPARQRHVHPGVWINDRKRKRVWVGSKVSRDRFKWWGVGYVSALGRRDDMAADAAHFRQAFRCRRRRRVRQRQPESQEASNKHENLRQQWLTLAADATS